jgi:hypothetical protein
MNPQDTMLLIEEIYRKLIHDRRLDCTCEPGQHYTHAGHDCALYMAYLDAMEMAADTLEEATP